MLTQEQIEDKRYKIAFRKDVVNMYDNDVSLQNIHTPDELCEEVIQQLNEYVDVSNGDKEGLVLFNLEMIYTLIEEDGVNEYNITFLSDSEEKLDFAKYVYRVKTFQLEQKHFELMKNGVSIMEDAFDYVVGNPPYQAPKDRKTSAKTGMCGGNLWDKFVRISHTVCKPNGFMALIHPGQWRKPEHALFSLFKKNNLEYLEMHNLKDGQDTFHVGTGYDWYIMQKSEPQGATTIKDMEGKTFDTVLTNWDFIPNCCFDLIDSLLAKDGEKKCNTIFSYSNYETRKE